MKSVNIHKDFFDVIKEHNNEDIGLLFLALAADVEESEAPELPPSLAVVRKLVNQQNQRFSKQQSDKRKPKQPNEPKIPNEPKQPTITVTNSNSNSEDIPPLPPKGEKEPEPSGAKRKVEIKAIWQSYSFSTHLGDAVKSWGEYKREKRQEYKPQGLKSLLSEVQNNAAKYGEDAVIALINKSMAANWQGIAWDKLEHLPDVRGSPKQKGGASYNLAELEQMLNKGAL